MDSQPESLLSQPELERWMKELARQLVGPIPEADDLVQDTLLAALKNQPSTDRPLKPWLSRVMRNRLHKMRRDEERRNHREARFAVAERDREDAQRSRQETQRIIEEEVLRLDEPYRSTILLRYKKGMAPQEIADRQGESVRTIHTRMTRAHSKLRSRIRSRLREAGNWRAALAMLFMDVPPPRSTARPRIGPSVTSVTALAVMALMIAVLVWLRMDAKSASARPSHPGPTSVAKRTSELPVVTRETMVNANQSRARPAETPKSRLAQPPATTAPLRGQVLDPEGNPVPQVQIEFQEGVLTGKLHVEQSFRPVSGNPDPTVVRTAADGSFEFPTPGDLEGRLIAASGRYVPVIAAVIPRKRSDPCTIVVAERRAVSGRVTSPSGAPVLGARVTLGVPEIVLLKAQRNGDRWVAIEPWAISNDRGDFEIPEAFDARGTRVIVTCPGYETTYYDLPGSGHDLSLILMPETNSDLRGVVRDRDRNPIAEAFVCLSGQLTRTTADGAFRLRRSHDPHEAVVAVSPGYLPTELRLGEERVQSVSLTLSGSPFAVSGCVVGPDDAPIRDASVWVIDPTPLASGAFVENIIRGFGQQDEALLRVFTDDQGRFEFSCLLDREYRFGAFVEDGLFSVESEPTPSGVEGVVLRIPLDEAMTNFTGVVRDRTGLPLSEIEVQPFRLLVQSDFTNSDRDITLGVPGYARTTDSAGQFRFSQLADNGLLLRVSGQGLITDYLDLDLVSGAPCLEVVMVREVSVRVDVSGAGTAVGFFDDEGSPVPITDVGQLSEFRETRATRAVVRHGTTAILIVPETACEAVLYQDETVLSRSRIRLTLESLNVVKL